MDDLLVIVPTRGRPGNARRVVEAWRATGGFDTAKLLFAVDADDPELPGYEAVKNEVLFKLPVSLCVVEQWKPMVHKLDEAARFLADEHFALAFAGDDHLPRTPGWASRYLEALCDLGTGIVYGDDLLQREKLPTQWAMTSDIVRALGRMVPAPVEHLYCDNAVLALGREADCIRYLPDVVVEHVHPVARKAPMDDGYRAVNAPAQYRRDGDAYRRWVAGGLARDASTVRALRAAHVGA